MELTRAIAIAVIAASLGLAAKVHAQSLKNVETPNEFPPASYKGKQYVDSKGCVYIRAGVDGNITWVPRMTRDRKVVCGYKPTNPNAAPTTASAQKLDKNVVVIQPAAPPTSTAAAAPKPKPKPKATTATTTTTTAAPKPKPKPKTTTTTATTTTAAAAPASTTTAKTKTNTPWWAKPPSTSQTTTTSAPAAKPKSTTTTTTTTSAPAAKPKTTTTTTTTTGNAQRSLDKTPRQSGFDAPCRGGVQGNYAVRCGPQSELPYTPGTGNPTAPPPRIIYNRQGASLYAPSQPAPGTVVREGEVASNVRVIPRHLYQNYQYALNEPEVPAGYARVFDDGRLNPQRAVMTFEGKAATDTVWTEKVPRRVRDDAPATAVVSTQSSTAAPTSVAPVISTKSRAPEKSLRLSASTYVQVATYMDSNAAQNSARQVRGLGLSTKIGKYEKGGQTYRMVLVGPFADPAQAESTVRKVRGAGYSDAFVR